MTTTPTLERITPHHTPNESWLAVHVARYDFASRYARPSGRLLDIACGSGHGTALLAERLPDVECLGVDLDGGAIAGANAHYARRNTKFINADGMTFVDATGFDTLVSLETIEHLEQPGIFVDRLVSMLRPQGRLIASVPSTPSTDANPFHRQDFTEASFKRLFTRHGLREIASIRLVDPFTNTPAFSRHDVDRVDLIRRMLGHYVRHPMSFVRRVGATLRYGLENRYITTAWERQ
ncbi:MAG: class I SAM-dependent methyltransferase [Gemmatimonadaceae bacterium]